MKLRNKKTGEIKDLVTIVHEAFNVHEVQIAKNIEANWEDVGDKDDANTPLIKDEKIRKAVRAWADAIGTASAFVEQGSFDNEHLELSDVLNRICFVTKRPKDIKAGIRYTITELCGEDK